jgi:short-chain fatty acids transporter
MKEMGVDYTPAAPPVGRAEKPGEWLEYNPLLTVVVCALGFGYLAREVATAGPASCWI